MLHAGLDLSRKRLDVCLLSEHGELVEEFSAPPDADGLRGLVRHVGHHGAPVRAVIESMTGARFVHDTLEQLGWEVLIADAQKVKGLAPLACKTDKIRVRSPTCSAFRVASCSTASRFPTHGARPSTRAS